MIKVGTSSINKMYLGLIEIRKAYLGTVEIYQTREAFASWLVTQSPAVQPTTYAQTSDILIGQWFNALPVQES